MPLIVLMASGNAIAVPSGYTLEYETSAGKVTFSGKAHAEAENTCIDCHLKPFRMKKGVFKMKSPHDQGDSCGTCHDGFKAFSVEAIDGCFKCHGDEGK